MVRGLYTAYTGLRNEEKRLDVISNNMANADTNGYKTEGTTSRAFSQVYGIKINDQSEANIQRSIGKMSLGVRIGQTYRDWSTGNFKTTDNTYDFALTGNGFFKVNMTDKEGKVHTRYTRDGSFTTTSDGYLVTKDGDYVLDDGGGKIQMPTTGSKPSVDNLGNITVDGKQIARIGITDFEDYSYLKQYGENQFDAVDGAKEKDYKGGIEQGLIETSNVNVVKEMVNMIAVTRAYETNQKAIQTIDSALDKTVNQVGRL